MATYDSAALARSATSLHGRASYIAFVYAALFFLAGLPVGTSAVIGINMVRRVHQIRTREDLDEAVHAEDKVGEVLSLFGHAPLGALMTAATLGAFGFIVGLARATELRTQAESALCLVQVEANTRRS